MNIPKIKPFVTLTLPSGDNVAYNEISQKDFIKGNAVEFCRVVTQVRNINDTGLTVFGETANIWMKYAQCFAGKPEDPPIKGSRYIQI